MTTEWSAESVASLPPPGMAGPSSMTFCGDYLTFVSSTIKRKSLHQTIRSPYKPLTTDNTTNSTTVGTTTTTTTTHSERICLYLYCPNPTTPKPLLLPQQHQIQQQRSNEESLEEKLRRERQRLSSSSSSSLTQFTYHKQKKLLLIPARGALYLQQGLGEDDDDENSADSSFVKCVHEGSTVDAQLSPDGSMVAWTTNGDLYAMSLHNNGDTATTTPIRLTFSTQNIQFGTADFIAQEEMDRYRGFWWHPQSHGIILTKVDETNVPVHSIHHTEETTPEDHRYPFCGKDNPKIQLGFLKIDRASLVGQQQQQQQQQQEEQREDTDVTMTDDSASDIARRNFLELYWFDPPREAPEYLARVYWTPHDECIAQWQNRTQTASVWMKLDLTQMKARTLLVERSDAWINLHHNFKILPRPIHPKECESVERNIPPIPNTTPLPPGSFSFLTTSEKSGYAHLYLYTYVPGLNGEQAILIRTLSAGEWMVDKVVGIDLEKDTVYFTGTYDSPLERHLYALPICRNRGCDEERIPSPNGVRLGLSTVMNAFKHKGNVLARPVRLTQESGMHSIVMDDNCQFFSDSGSDLDRPTSVRLYRINGDALLGSSPELVYTLYDASVDVSCLLDLPEEPINGKTPGQRLVECLPPPEVMTFPTLDGTETLYANVYKPNRDVFGPGPYPLVVAVYGGPHVQRVNRSWSQSADMRAQRLSSLGFCVVKCDNRGSSRRGMAFETAISKRLGKLEVLDQVAAVRQLTIRGIADASRVGVYGWSYGGYLAAMCLCRAPDTFHVAVAGAPVTSWDGYDTHYTERYMGLPCDNPAGYRESAVFEHVPNMRGKLMIVHGLIDENVHFRHTTRLINKLIAAGKDYDLLIFPEERHSPRRLRDRIYMEQRISGFFMKHLGKSALEMLTSVSHSDDLNAIRSLAGRL